MRRTIRERSSPNHDARPAGRAIDMLVLHYTGMPSAAAALDRLTDPAAKVSAHYAIDEDGTVWRLVPETRRAWHAGVACWAGERDINGLSIGVELVNPGHEFGYRPFPDAQMTALEELARDILARHPIPASRVLGHSDVAPGRKTDPGELFDWRRLAATGVGLWPEPAADGDVVPDIAEVQAGLARFGYDVAAPSGILDATTETALAAFQRHFRPQLVNGRPDAETATLLDALLAQAG